jgi:large subunit ribosomal protein L25
MSQATLSAKTNREIGSRPVRRMRTAGIIPGVVYGEGVVPLPVAVNAKEFRTAVSGDQGLNTLITLDADGTTYIVMAREIQRHPVRGTVAHVDFQVVDPNKGVTVEIPLHLVGDAVDVRHADWEIDQQLFNIAVTARPDQIPTHLDVDISALKPGDSIRISDIIVPSGVVAAQDHAISVVTTRAGRAVKTATPGAPE